MLPERVIHEHEKLPDEELRIIREKEEHRKNKSYYLPVEIDEQQLQHYHGVDNREGAPADSVKRVKE